jgi:hypothetical protein
VFDAIVRLHPDKHSTLNESAAHREYLAISFFSNTGALIPPTRKELSHLKQFKRRFATLVRWPRIAPD